MTVYHAICLEDYTPNAEQDATFVLKRGQEYTVSAERDGHRVVFSRYWVSVPARLFGGVQPLVRSGSHDAKNATSPVVAPPTPSDPA